jgi:hypothetical protein
MTLKHELLQTAAMLGLPITSFRTVGINEWEPIMKKIEERFVKDQFNKWVWWWDGHFKDPVYASGLFKAPFVILNELVPVQELVWFIAEGRKNKFWLFEGDIESIQKVIGESYAFEYYIVSKKYEWLLCENHHDVLFGVGEIIIERLKQAEQKLAK